MKQEEIIKLYEGAVLKWGMDDQLNIVNEELAELIVVLNHLRRGRCGINELIEEIADTELVLGQLKHIYTIKEEYIALFREMKLKRLKQRLEDSKYEQQPE